MILVRSPLRITLGGGGTDLPVYYERYGGMFVTAAIEVYVYVSVLKPFESGILLKYGHGGTEKVATIDQIAHSLIREVLRLCAPEDWTPQIEITTLADVPAGTGLGSSSACACALLKALTTFFQPNAHESCSELAENACHLEMSVLREPIGKQDAYASAFGGLTPFVIDKQGDVTAQPRMDWRIQEQLERRLHLYFTGYSRSASEILRPVAAGGADDNLHIIRHLGDQMLTSLHAGSLWNVGPIFTEQWRRKVERSPNATNAHIDHLYNVGMAAGASGGKLVGAGGGGFLLFYAPDGDRLEFAMAREGVSRFPFRLEEGSGTLVVCE